MNRTATQRHLWFGRVRDLSASAALTDGVDRMRNPRTQEPKVTAPHHTPTSIEANLQILARGKRRAGS